MNIRVNDGHERKRHRIHQFLRWNTQPRPTKPPQACSNQQKDHSTPVSADPQHTQTSPVFHPPFHRLNTHLPHVFFDFNTCIFGPHISLSIVTPKTAYYLINIVMKTQTLPFASSIAVLLNDMCPLVNISYFLLAFPLRLVSPRRNDLPFPCWFPFRHVFQDAIRLLHCTDAQTSHVITSRQEGHYTYIRRHLLFY